MMNFNHSIFNGERGISLAVKKVRQEDVMKKSIISVAVLSFLVSTAIGAQTQSSIPGFNDDTAPGTGLGGSLSGSSGSSTSSGYSGSSATGTPGALNPPQNPGAIQQQNELNTFEQQRMENRDLSYQDFDNQNMNVPQTEPNLPQTQPSNTNAPGTGTGIGTGRGTGTINP
jgi:hypothetical protein